MNLAGDDPEHIIVVPGSLFAPTADAAPCVIACLQTPRLRPRRASIGTLSSTPSVTSLTVTGICEVRDQRRSAHYCTAAIPATGTPEAPGRRVLSRRRASSSRSASRQAFNKVNSIRSCCARLPPMRSFSPASGASASIARGKIPALERREAARQRRQVGAGRVAPLARQLLHLAGAGLEPGLIAHDRLRQNDVQIGEPAARPRQRAVRIVVHRAPGGGVARMAGEFGTPQKRRPIRHFLLRPAAVPVERDGVPIQPQRLVPNCRPGFRRARDASSDGHRKTRRADRSASQDDEIGAGRIRARRFRNRHGRNRARHARCSGSAPRIARSSAGPPRAAHPRTAPWRDRPGTRNRRRNAGRGCPSAPRSDASARCGRRRRSGRWGSRRWRRTSASRGHAARCAYKAAIAASVRPANTRSKNAMWLASRSDRPVGRVLGRRQGRSAPPRRCLPASAPGPCRRGPGQNRGRRRWRGHRPRRRPGRKSAPDRSLNIGVPRGGRRGRQAEAISICQHQMIPTPISAYRVRPSNGLFSRAPRVRAIPSR